MRKDKDTIRLFPEYFDRNISRRNGRRLSRQSAIKEPKLLELKLAAQKMGLITEEKKEASHPCFPINRRGMLLVSFPDNTEERIKKTALIKRISDLTISFSRPLIEQKIKDDIEKRKKEAQKRKSSQKRKFGTEKQKRGSKRTPKPRRR